MEDLQLKYPIKIELDNVKDTKLKLIKTIAKLINERYKTQKKAAGALKIDQPKVSQINRLRIEGFSPEYMLNLLVMLDQGVNVKVISSSESE